MDQVWDRAKMIVFLSVLGVFGLLCFVGKISADALIASVIGLLSPSMLPFGRKATGATLPPPGKP